MHARSRARRRVLYTFKEYTAGPHGSSCFSLSLPPSLFRCGRPLLRLVRPGHLPARHACGRAGGRKGALGGGGEGSCCVGVRVWWVRRREGARGRLGAHAPGGRTTWSAAAPRGRSWAAAEEEATPRRGAAAWCGCAARSRQTGLRRLLRNPAVDGERSCAGSRRLGRCDRRYIDCWNAAMRAQDEAALALMAPCTVCLGVVPLPTVAPGSFRGAPSQHNYYCFASNALDMHRRIRFLPPPDSFRMRRLQWRDSTLGFLAYFGYVPCK